MGEEGHAKVGQMGLPALEPGKIVRIPLVDLHEFLERHGVEIVGRLSGPDAKRLVVELAPVGDGILRPCGHAEAWCGASE